MYRMMVTAACALLLAACGDSSEEAAVPAAVPATTPITAPAANDSIALSAPSYSVAQSSGTLTVTVNRAGSSSGTASVAYATANGTAVAGTDYAATTGTLNWASGDSGAKSFSVPIITAATFAGSKSFTVTLSDPRGTAAIVAPGSAVATIAGAAASAAGSLQLSAAGYQVMQNGGPLFVVVNRTGGAVGTVGVTYATANGSAAAGTDYAATNGTLQWSDGDTGSRAFPVAIGNAIPFSGARTFSIALSAPTNGASLGNVAAAVVSITGSNSGSAGASGSTFWVYRKGTFYWAGDVSYGGLAVNYSSTAGEPTDGPFTVSLTGNNGGFQPRAQNDDFDTTPYKYLTIVLKPTIPNQAWVSGFASVGDKPVGVLVNVTNFGPKPPVAGQWNTYKIPLGAGGYQMANGSHIYKVTFQDETANQPGYSGPTNVWYVDSIAFTAN